MKDLGIMAEVPGLTALYRIYYLFPCACVCGGGGGYATLRIFRIKVPVILNDFLTSCNLHYTRVRTKKQKQYYLALVYIDFENI